MILTWPPASCPPPQWGPVGVSAGPMGARSADSMIAFTSDQIGLSLFSRLPRAGGKFEVSPAHVCVVSCMCIFVPLTHTLEGGAADSSMCVVLSPRRPTTV